MEFKADTRFRFVDQEEMFLLKVALGIMAELMNGIVDRSDSKMDHNAFHDFKANASLYADVVQLGVGQNAIGWCRTVLSGMRKDGVIGGFTLEFVEAPSNRVIVARLSLSREGAPSKPVAFLFTLDMENGFAELGLV
jgi:hypothetical protein